jgi:hypothetical protein
VGVTTIISVVLVLLNAFVIVPSQSSPLTAEDDPVALPLIPQRLLSSFSGVIVDAENNDVAQRTFVIDDPPLGARVVLLPSSDTVACIISPSDW